MVDRSCTAVVVLALSCGLGLVGVAHAGESYAQAVTDLVVFQTDLSQAHRQGKGHVRSGLGDQGTGLADQNDYFNVSIKVPEGTTPYLTLGWGRLDQAPGWRLSANVGATTGQGKAPVAAQAAGSGAPPGGTEQPLRPDASQSKASPQLTLGARYRY